MTYKPITNDKCKQILMTYFGVRLATFCFKVFETPCPQNAWQTEIIELPTVFDNFYSISLEQFRKKRFTVKSRDDRSDLVGVP